MVIRFLEDTNIRKSIDNLLLPPVGIVFKGTGLEVENRLFQGAPIQEISTYFRDCRGWYYWSGKVVILYKALPSPSQKMQPTLPEEDRSELIGPPWEPEAGSPVPSEEEAAILLPEEFSEPTTETGEAVTESPLPPDERREEVPSSLMPEEEVETKEELQSAEPPFEVVEEAASGRSQQPLTGPEEIRPAFAFGQSTLSQAHWGLKALKIPSLFWQENNLTGKGVRIALLDTGIGRHCPSLEGRIREQIDLCAFPPENHAADQDGHGTACAEILCAQGQSGIIGAAPEANLFVGRIMQHFFDLNYGRLIEGIHWALQLPADIIFTGLELKPSSLTERQIEELRQLTEMAAQQNVLLVASAGDSKMHRPDNRYPASLENVISVGSHDRSYRRHPLSIKSLQLDVLAPGGALLPEDRIKALGLSAHITGFSAALATGALALIVQYLKDRNLSISGEDFLYLIRSTATPLIPGNVARDVEYGFGFFNPEELLAEIKRQENAFSTG